MPVTISADLMGLFHVTLDTSEQMCSCYVQVASSGGAIYRHKGFICGGAGYDAFWLEISVTLLDAVVIRMT